MSKPYDDIPGTYVMDGAHSRRGYKLNMFCMSLNSEDNRETFRQDESIYIDGFGLTAEQKQADRRRARGHYFDSMAPSIYHIKP